MQKRLSILSIAALLLCGGAAQAKGPNPLISPKPAGADQATPSANGGGAAPASPSSQLGAPPQRQGLSPGMPQGMPPAPAYAGQMGDAGLKQKVEPAFPADLVGLDDKWFVSAITGNAAILRLRDASIGVAAPSASSTGSAGQPGQMPMGLANMPMQGATATAGASVIQRSILVSNGKQLDFKGFPLQVSIQDGIVRLTHLHEGQRVSVYQSGVDVFAVRRATQTTKETPAANLPRLMSSGGTTPGTTGASTGTPSSGGMTGGQTF